ncbi:MAG: aldehyde dehydrogenase family protein [Pseudohaliea sp.]
MESQQQPAYRADLQEVFARQHRHKWVQRSTSAQARIDRLTSLKAAIEAAEDDIRTALWQDLRKTSEHTQVELNCSYSDIDFAVSHLEDWLKPRPVDRTVLPTGHAEIRYEARGQVLLFGPWNFPFSLVIQPLVPIIAAGNCVVVKPNELTPATSELVAGLLAGVFPEEEVAVVEGDVETANALLELPFDHIFLTGSPAVGKLVMKAAANHLASVTLELGGKNPVIIDGSADLSLAAEHIARVRLMNHGQICLAPENVWVPEERLEEFLGLLESALKSLVYTDGKLDVDVCGRIVNEGNLRRVTGYIDDATAKGARVVCGGTVFVDRFVLEPTILADIPASAKVLREEIFGPVVCVFGYQDIATVFSSLQAQPDPLSLYVFSEETAFVEAVLANTSSGGVTVNSCLAHFLEQHLPFGGKNNSGLGAYHGERGFRELSHERAVFVQ